MSVSIHLALTVPFLCLIVDHLLCPEKSPCDEWNKRAELWQHERQIGGRILQQVVWVIGSLHRVSSDLTPILGQDVFCP
jgi:hypothetical protein